MIRIYKRNDHKDIAEIFCRAVHEIASLDYTPEQCLAWSSIEPNYDYWKKRCEFKRPFVIEINSSIAGFLELDTDGHIDCAYVNPDFSRQKVMTKLVKHAIKTAFAMEIPRIYVEASYCIRPLFEKEGFDLISEQTVNCNGVQLTNFVMELR